MFISSRHPEHIQSVNSRYRFVPMTLSSAETDKHSEAEKRQLIFTWNVPNCPTVPPIVENKTLHSLLQTRPGVDVAWREN